jgi:hypothetical protein
MTRPKLTPTMRDEMIQRRRAGTRIKVLVRDYGVSPNTITRTCGPLYPKMSAAVAARQEKAR